MFILYRTYFFDSCEESSNVYLQDSIRFWTHEKLAKSSAFYILYVLLMCIVPD